MTHRITHTVGRSGWKRCRRSDNAYTSSRRDSSMQTLREILDVFLENLIFLETGKFFNVYPFALKAPPQSLLRCLGRSVTHYLHPRNFLEAAWRLSRKHENS